jgi:AcrR family transcriptional regulator
MPKLVAQTSLKKAARTPGRGERSRAAILRAAAELATLRGLDGLSIGDLAARLGMSKSGLYAHFKSKEELELATIETAVEIFDREVLRPAMAAPAGVGRLRALANEFLAHLKRRVFPGGCFFAAVAAEMGMRPGPVRDRVVQTLHDWLALLEQCVRDGQRQAEIDPAADVAQVVFEVEAMLSAANALFVISGNQKTLTQGRRGLEHLLERFSPRDQSSPQRPHRS